MAARRELLGNARRIMVKLGSAIVTRSDGAGIALGRTANIVEQVSHLQAAGREMVIVSSGAVAAGRNILRPNNRRSPTDVLPIPSRPLDRLTPLSDGPVESSPSHLAAVGQGSLIALYDAMFKVYGISTAQVLLGLPDLLHTESREAACNTVKGLVDLGVVPILNENDAVSGAVRSTPGDGSIPIDLTDNDSLSAVLAKELGCDLLLLLSNTDGVYTGDPADPASELIPMMRPEDQTNQIEFAAKSSMGRGGMASKVTAAQYAAENGVMCVIANGLHWRSVLDIIEGKPLGTLFTTPS